MREYYQICHVVEMLVVVTFDSHVADKLETLRIRSHVIRVQAACANKPTISKSR